MQHAHVRCSLESPLQLVEQTALAHARLAEHRDHGSLTVPGAGDVRLQHQELGLPADLRRQIGSARCLEARDDPGLTDTRNGVSTPICESSTTGGQAAVCT